MTKSHLAGVATIAILALNSATASAAKLAPQEQLEQTCDAAGMSHLNADKVIAYTFARPKIDKTTFTAPGAVFRRHGQWYRLSYKCTASSDLNNVTKFTYKIGQLVPHAQWDKYYLYP